MSDEGINSIKNHIVMSSSGTASAMTGKLLAEPSIRKAQPMNETLPDPEPENHR